MYRRAYTDMEMVTTRPALPPAPHAMGAAQAPHYRPKMTAISAPHATRALSDHHNPHPYHVRDEADGHSRHPHDAPYPAPYRYDERPTMAHRYTAPSERSQYRDAPSQAHSYRAEVPYGYRAEEGGAPRPYAAMLPPAPAMPPRGHSMYEVDQHPSMRYKDGRAGPHMGHGHAPQSVHGMSAPLDPRMQAPMGHGHAHHHHMHDSMIAPNLPPPPSSAMYDGRMVDAASMMHMGSPGDQRPTYVGYIKSAHDAILLLSACDLPADAVSPHSPNQQRDGLRGKTVPPPRRVTRRLLDAERADMVVSGCVFAWDEKEAGMKRWTDGRVWSASRVSGCFLTYRELEARKKANGAASDGPTSNQYKPEGLIKQSFSVTTASGRKLHVISYFTKRDVRECRLRRVSEDPRFVGEGGGEWGLTVDRKEYSFPDSNAHRGTASNGFADGMGDVNSDIMDDDDEDEVERIDPRGRGGPMEVMPTVQRTVAPSAAHPSSPHRDQRPPPAQPMATGAGTSASVLVQQPRKRSVPDDFESHMGLSRPPPRPLLQRKRSSSLSNTPSWSGGEGTPLRYSKYGSFPSHSGSSNATSIPAETPELVKTANPINRMTATADRARGPEPMPHSASSAIRALVSPTLPRESAMRGSAHDMRPSDSQESASAVGALLSLAGGPKKAGPSPLSAAPSSGSDSAEPHSPAEALTAPAGLGLNLVKPSPERRDSDRDALNMFSVRL